MNVRLPEMFMALAFPKQTTNDDTKQLRDADLELCRIATQEYLLPKLQLKYPRLSQIQLTYRDLEWGTGKPEAKFQAYWKADATLQFTSTPADKASQTEPAPRPMMLFESLGGLFRKEFYLEFLREHPRIIVQGTGGRPASLTTTATDVQVGLMPQATEGGAVKAPNFYMGFVCDPPPTKRPTAEQLERLRDYSFPRMLRKVRKAYEETLDKSEKDGGMTLKVAKSEINQQAGKPVDTFNLYVEFEAIGIFTKNAPPPMQFYAALASFSLDEFLPGMVSTLGGGGGGGCLARSNQMAINPCAWIENLQHHKTADPMNLGDLVPVHVEFWLALVLPQPEAAVGTTRPTESEITVFDTMMQDFLHQTLLVSFGSYNFHSIDLQRESCELDANVPLPRFNILHRYQADILFANPIPDPPHVLSKIMRCDVGTLIGKISILPSPWDGTMEGTLGSAMFQKSPEEKVYEGRMSDKPKVVAPLPPAPKVKKVVPQPSPTPPAVQKPTEVPPAVKRPTEVPKKAVPKPSPAPSPPPLKKPEELVPKVVAKVQWPPPPMKPEIPSKPRLSATETPALPTTKASPRPAPTPLVAPARTSIVKVPAPAPPKKEPKPVVKPATAPAPAPVPAPIRKTQPSVSTTKPKPPPPAPKPQPTKPATPPAPTPPPEDVDASKAEKDSIEFWAEIFVALKIEDKPEPTPAEYEKLAKATKSFYSKFLSKRYGKDTFQSIAVSIRATKYNAGIPEPQYNVYVEWDIQAHFDATTGNAPDRLEFCAALASEIDMLVYLKDRIRVLTKTPFENSVAIYTEQVNSLKK